MPQHVVVLRRYQVVIAFVAITVAFVVQGLLLTNTTDNLNRTIKDVNHDRLVSCQRGYEGVREIFQPFFPPASKETPTQRRNRHKFNRRVDLLKARCDQQIVTKGTS